MSATDERRASFKRYKEDVERGKPFFPYAMFHDTVMSLVVVAVIIALACIWNFTADGPTPGGIGPWYSDEADPGTTNFIPRPDWYFYFLFYLLRIFKWPETVILGTVGIPTLLMVLLFAVPFIDRRQERRLSRRPVAVIAAVLTAVSMGVLTYKGATAKESLGSEAVAAVDSWSEQQGGFSPEAPPRRGDLRAGRLPPVPRLPRLGVRERRRARALGHRLVGPERRLLPPLRREPVGVREQRDALVPEPRRREPERGRDLPLRVQGRQVSSPMHVVPA